MSFKYSRTSIIRTSIIRIFDNPDWQKTFFSSNFHKIEFFQKKRLELYEKEPLMKEINLDLLDKKSNIAQHKLKELIDARQGLEQWQKYGDDFWQISPPYSIRSTQQDCVKQLIEINKSLGRPTSSDYLFLTAKNRENYLQINKAWSMTFDCLYQDQVNRSYFPNTRYELPKVEFYRS